ncbi:hypothetical protein [Flavisolibacter tropicus]|uniref:Uncharacterized protein n=1 Tax=Flavisolibacter tropicus TaxID=1492898 RepID=A0A172U0V1_9BACT|nr:hypothetical protein [Flavisolibacter tropicus]ANE52981.1 hypothetical protein SY85_23400 [Flavisolibacter tropicus]
MKFLIRTLLASLFALWLCNCAAPDLGELGVEQDLVVALDPDAGSAIARTLGTTYDFKVLVKSSMPPQGVTISVVYRQDIDNAVVFSQNYTTKTSPQQVTITNIPFNEVGTVTIIVTSKGEPDNTVTKTFKLVRK